MCGIAFLYNPNLSSDELARKMQHSLAVMQHRGPDDEGIWQGAEAVLGHRRLSIIDLTASCQPMTDQSERYVLVYNGEVYNYQKLRSGLEKRWAFKTNGDTEVLLAGLVLHGISFLSRMEGMWAFALWDNREKRLLLGRDRMGKKPLYFQETRDGFLCTSELPALACLTDETWQEDLDSTADFFRYGYYLPGTTAYHGIREMLPGHISYWTPESGIRQEPYWSLNLTSFNGSREEAGKKLYDYLTQAVKKRLVADVEVGSFLSGGIDSSLVVSILTKKLGVIPKTFTIGFTEKSYDERLYASQMADYCGTDHYVQVLDGWNKSELTRLILKNVGQPFADSSLLPTALVSRVAAAQVKVVLSGDGGDELFSGYQRYQARSILRWYTRLPKPLRWGIGKLIRAMPEPMAHHSRSILKKAHLFQDIVDRLEWETPYTAPVLYSQQVYSQLAPDLAGRGHSPPNLPEECSVDDIGRMMMADAIIYLPQDILLKVDRASMACSLETRAPFLDSKVVELAFSCPSHWHRNGFVGKKMLRRTFHDLLPNNIWKRRKQGFAVPLHTWFREGMDSELLNLCRCTNSPLNHAVVQSLLDAHMLGRIDNGYRLWSLYIYLLWKNEGIVPRISDLLV